MTFAALVVFLATVESSLLRRPEILSPVTFAALVVFLRGFWFRDMHWVATVSLRQNNTFKSYLECGTDPLAPSGRNAVVKVLKGSYPSVIP